MKPLQLVKIGGNIIDKAEELQSFLTDFAAISQPKILVHGGGKLATELAEKLSVPQTMTEGRRITDAATLDIIVMVYAGLINKSIVASLQALQCNAAGFSGADASIVSSTKRASGSIDFGFVGDIKPGSVNTAFLSQCLEQNIIPVICPVTHDGKGQLLNTNADTMASEIAVAMSAFYEVSLSYGFEKKGVLKNPGDDDSVTKILDTAYYHQLKSENMISKGMIPKLDNAFKALSNGVGSVRICHASDILKPAEGTSLSLS